MLLPRGSKRTLILSRTRMESRQGVVNSSDIGWGAGQRVTARRGGGEELGLSGHNRIVGHTLNFAKPGIKGLRITGSTVPSRFDNEDGHWDKHMYPREDVSLLSE